ncbi:MAG: hypothetical protein KA151_01060 [Piscinibacter sp.]|nr:hypothetical protein [Piscinibacter sp.]
MNIRHTTVALALAGATLSPALAATSVGVSVSVVQPGIYGRIDIGGFPQPAVIYPQPVVYAPPPVAVVHQPVYLYVPPGHQKHWGKHCGRYNACGVPVYFVQETWVRERYEGEKHHGKGSKGKGKGKGDD